MTISARFVHTNVVARDWKRLAQFYQRVFGCKPVPPERHLVGHGIEAATGIPEAEIEGIHLRLLGTPWYRRAAASWASWLLWTWRGRER